MAIDPSRIAARSGACHRSAPFLLASALLISIGAPAAGAGFDPTSLEDLVLGSELIFHGVVEDVTHAGSEPIRPGSSGLPHTFVTFRIEQIFAGRTESSTLTLRFRGGIADDRAIHHYYSASPQFDVGDEDLLFVRDNGRRPVPLAGWNRGHLRIVEGGVEDHAGHRIVVDQTGRVRPLVRSRRSSSGDTDTCRAVQFDEVATVLEGVIARVHTAASIADLPLVSSEDPAAPFQATEPRPMPPPAPPEDDLAPRPTADPEVLALQANGFNPVLPPDEVERLEVIR